MHFYILPFLLAAYVYAVPKPQSLNDLPVCAQQAGLAAIDATSCGLDDVACICSAVPFLNTLRSYIEQHCDTSDQSAALSFGETLCASYGVTFSASVTVPISTTTIPETPMVTVAPLTTALAGTATSTISATTIASTASAPVVTASFLAKNCTALVTPFIGGTVGGLEYKVAVVFAGFAGLVAFVV